MYIICPIEQCKLIVQLNNVHYLSNWTMYIICPIEQCTLIVQLNNVHYLSNWTMYIICPIEQYIIWQCTFYQGLRLIRSLLCSLKKFSQDLLKSSPVTPHSDLFITTSPLNESRHLTWELSFTCQTRWNLIRSKYVSYSFIVKASRLFSF